MSIVSWNVKGIWVEVQKQQSRRLGCVMMTVQHEAILAEIRQSLSEGWGPFHGYDEHFGNRTMYVPGAETEYILNEMHTHTVQYAQTIIPHKSLHLQPKKK